MGTRSLLPSTIDPPLCCHSSEMLRSPTARWTIPIAFVASCDAYRASRRRGDVSFDLSPEWQANVSTITAGSDCAIVIDGPGWVIVSVAGSDDFDDWMSNKKVARVPEGPAGAWVHEGFADGYNALREGVDDAILDMLGSRIRQQGHWNDAGVVHFVGHSRGGGIAQLLALDCFIGRTATTQCITFGSPRVFDKSAKIPEDFRRRLWRVEHSNDIVTHMPTAWRFRHRGHRLTLTETGSLFQDLPLWRLLRTKWKGYHADAATDHLMTEYDAALSALIEGDWRA